MTGEARGSKALAVFVLSIFVASTVPMAGLSLEVSDEIRITDNDDPEGAQRVEMDSDGNIHIAYLMNDGGDNDKLMYRKVSPTGTTEKGPIQISPSSVDSGYGQLAIVVDTNDRAHIAFSVKLTNDDARDIYYAQVSATGSVSVAARNVHSSETDASALDIDTDGSGNSCIVWNERTAPPTIKWMKVSSSGSVVRAAKTISGDLGTGGDLAYPRLGTSSSGDSFVVWQQKSNQLVRWSIYYTALTPSGSVDVDPSQVVSSPVYDLSFLEASADSQGDLHVTYVQNDAINYAVVDDSGALDANYELSSSLLGELTGPDIAIAPNDDMYLVYMMRENPINAPWHAFVRVWSESNDSWSGANIVDEGTNSPSLVRVGAGPNGGAVVFLRGGDLWLVTVEGEEPNNPPVASLSLNPIGPGIGETVVFDGSASSDPDDGDSVDEYFFDYGDGGDSGWTTSYSVNHAYTSAGTYTARLRVRDSHGTESTSASQATVQVTSTPTNRAPTAVLSANPTTVDVGKTVTFNGDSSSDSDGVVQFWNFNFGDSVTTGWVTSSVQTHSYTAASTYTATLKVKDDDGDESENTASIQIAAIETNEPPTATITSITPSPALQGEDVTFVGSGEDPDGNVVEYEWESDFDGIFGSQATVVTHSLTVASHTITLKVKDNDDEWSEVDTATLEVKPNTNPQLVDVTKFKGTITTDTLNEFRVEYTDAEGDTPTSAKFWYGQAGDYKFERLLEVDTTDKDYTDGKEYYFNLKLKKAGKWMYYFEFENLKNPKKKTLAKEVKVEEPSGFLPGWEALPAAGSMLAAAVAVATLRRRERRT